jgi:hypothetical protein
VFSLGAIAYELLTGRRPSGTGDEIGSLAGAGVGPHAEMVLSVLATAMDPDPSRRHKTALAFAGALEGASRGESSVVSIAPPSPPAAPVAPPIAPVAAKTAAPVTLPAPADDISSERDEDEAHFALSLKEQEEAEGEPEVQLELESEAEAGADRFAVAPPPAVTDPAAGPYRDDFRPPPSVPSVTRDAEAVTSWDGDRGQRIFDPPAEYRGAVVPTQGSRVLPLAAMLSVGLLVGFAVGYGVGTRNPGATSEQTAASPSTQPAPAPAPAGRDYSEQTVAPRGTGDAQPSATPPPVPTDAPAAAAPRRPAATTGRVVVESIPSRAGVMVNGRWRGRTPLAIEQLPFGQYTVRVVQPGYLTAEQDLRLSAGDPIETLSVRLQRQPPPARTAASPAPAPAPRGGFTGTIFVDSRPRGARIFVDNKPVGTTPLSLPEVPVGTHVVRLELADHRAWSVSTRVTSGQTARVTGSLERIQ